MGTLEALNQRTIKRSKVQRAILSCIAAAGVIGVVAIAPNVVGALGILRFIPQRRAQINDSLSRLIKAGFVEVIRNENSQQVQLTQKGEIFLGDSAPKRQRRKWDGKWRIVMYDFHGPAKNLRHRVRSLLAVHGFQKLQGSVWISPHDTEDFIALMKTELHIGKSLLYMIVDHIENDQALRVRFSLPAR